MKQFKISQNLDKNKVFIVNFSEIEGRLDPLFYSNNIFGFLKETKFDIKTIREISQYTIAGFGVGKEGQNLNKEGYIQIRPTNVDEYGLLKFDKNIYLDEEYLTKKSENIIQKGDVLFNNTNSQELVGKTSYFDLDQTCLHSNHITRIKVNKDLILPKYLWRLLNFYQKRKIFYSICTNWNNQSGVGIELLNSLKIPVPPKTTQEKIVQIMDNAYLLKKQNEAEAEKLLASIDDYLLGELGIKLPSQPENSLKNRIFYTSLKEISGGRFDPFFYQNHFSEFKLSLNAGIYANVKLNSLCDLQNGFAFKSNDYIESSKTFNIRMSNIRPNNNFDPDYNVQYLPDNYSTIYKDYLLNDGDLIIAMTDMASDPKILGVPTIVSGVKDRKFLLNQRVGRLCKFDVEKINVEYLKYILGSKLIKEFYNQLGARGVQINISREQILSVKIPLPPLPKQQEIANHITKIRNQAQLLKEQANIAIKQANQEIEQILLGN